MGPETGIVALVMYFLPTLIAMLRGHDNTFAIFLTNLIFGFTVIGWFIAFIWSFTANRRARA